MTNPLCRRDVTRPIERALAEMVTWLHSEHTGRTALLDILSALSAISRKASSAFACWLTCFLFVHRASSASSYPHFWHRLTFFFLHIQNAASKPSRVRSSCAAFLPEAMSIRDARICAPAMRAAHFCWAFAGRHHARCCCAGMSADT